jgi:hypothetical protein
LETRTLSFPITKAIWLFQSIHHDDDPPASIKVKRRNLDPQPNGSNLGLKVIEKLSHHRERMANGGQYSSPKISALDPSKIDGRVTNARYAGFACRYFSPAACQTRVLRQALVKPGVFEVLKTRSDCARIYLATAVTRRWRYLPSFQSYRGRNKIAPAFRHGDAIRWENLFF